eukprot:8877203-Pyramimonas_sp.AAC.1
MRLVTVQFIYDAARVRKAQPANTAQHSTAPTRLLKTLDRSMKRDAQRKGLGPNASPATIGLAKYIG